MTVTNEQNVEGKTSVHANLGLLIFLRRVAFLVTVSASAFGQSGPVPSYISTIPEFHVSRLGGELAPLNGALSIRDITPEEWLTNDPGTTGLRSVIMSWNGGAKGIGTKLYVHGGGHSNSANNGLYIFDFAGSERPNGWVSPLLISPISAIVPNEAAYSDGLPVSVHTYDGLVYADNSQTIYRFSGSQYNNGFMTNAAFKWNATSNEWIRLPNYPSAAGGSKTLYDSRSGKIFVTMTRTSAGHFFDTSTDTWSDQIQYAGLTRGFPFNVMGALDPTRNRGIIVGDSEARLLEIDFSAETVRTSDLEITGDTEIITSGGISALYDTMMDVYWLFGGGENSPGWNSIYRMNANGPPWNIQAVPLTGDPILRTSNMHGSWGRYAFMPNWRAIGLLGHHNEPPSILRLPSEFRPVPQPPENLGADEGS